MTTNRDSLKRITDLKAEIARLEGAALKELREKRTALLTELATVEAKIVELGGAVVIGRSKRGPRQQPAGKSLPLQELKALLEHAPEKTLNVRKENLELRNIKVLAEANPQLLKFGGKGAWPTVTLLK
jgi:hypothetical protein